MKKNKIRFMSLVAAVVMSFSAFGGNVAYAAEDANNKEVSAMETNSAVYNIDGTKVTIVGLEEDDSVEGILAMASETIENADEDVTIMPLASYGSGTNYVGSFTFYDENWGAYHTINGSKMKYLVAYKKADNLQYSIDLFTACYQYGGKQMESRWCYAGSAEWYEDGYGYYLSDQFKIVSGVDYRFYYSCCSSGSLGGDDEVRTVAVKLWVIVE